MTEAIKTSDSALLSLDNLGSTNTRANLEDYSTAPP